MARRWPKFRAIAAVAFQETMRRKVFYLVGILALLILGSMASEYLFVSMASEAGEARMISNSHLGFVNDVLGMWGFATTMLAVYLGAVALPSEVTNKTLVGVFARPVDRAGYLTARWSGTFAFLLAFRAIGLVIALAAVRYYGIDHTPMLWLGLGSTIVYDAYYCGLSMGFSVVMPPILAGSVALLLGNLPGMVEDWLKSPTWVVRDLASFAYYLGPAKMPADLIADAFKKQLTNPPLGLYTQVIVENLLYAAIVFGLCAWMLRRREIRLR